MEMDPIHCASFSLLDAAVASANDFANHLDGAHSSTGLSFDAAHDAIFDDLPLTPVSSAASSRAPLPAAVGDELAAPCQAAFATPAGVPLANEAQAGARRKAQPARRAPIPLLTRLARQSSSLASLSQASLSKASLSTSQASSSQASSSKASASPASLSKASASQASSSSTLLLGPTGAASTPTSQSTLGHKRGYTLLSGDPSPSASGATRRPRKRHRPASKPHAPTASHTQPPPNDRHLPSTRTSQGSSNAVAKQNKRNHEYRRKKRLAAHAIDASSGSFTPEETATRHVDTALPAVGAPTYDVSNIPAASTGYVTLPEGSKGRVYSLDELVNKMGFKLIEATLGQAPRPIVDKNGLVIAVIVPPPNMSEWEHVHLAAHQMLLEAATRCKLVKSDKVHRRGRFGVLNVGIAMGMGLTFPSNLTHLHHNADELENLLHAEPFVRISGFASSAFRTWAPKLHLYYSDHLDLVIGHDRTLRRNFYNTVWAATAFNLGPRTITNRHRDCQNLPFGWCGVTALGDFDYKLGGHLILWELKLVLEFPPGWTILLPSAAIGHSNTPIQKHETRTSFTQYSAGGIFRWAQHGFMDKRRFSESLKTPADTARVKSENEARCKLGLQLFSTLDELRAPKKPQPGK